MLSLQWRLSAMDLKISLSLVLVIHFHGLLSVNLLMISSHLYNCFSLARLSSIFPSSMVFIRGLLYKIYLLMISNFFCSSFNHFNFFFPRKLKSIHCFTNWQSQDHIYSYPSHKMQWGKSFTMKLDDCVTFACFSQSWRSWSPKEISTKKCWIMK